MAEKTIASYRQVFQTLKLKVREVTRNNNWQPRFGITDFELALITRIRGCYFHFSQSLWRKIQKLGLSGPYRQDRHLKNYSVR